MMGSVEGVPSECPEDIPCEGSDIEPGNGH